MLYYIITNMPGRSREGARVSKLYKLKMQGKDVEQPKEEKKEEKKKSKPKKEEKKVEVKEE